jgi:Domain of unknown function (DUF4390)
MTAFITRCWKNPLERAWLCLTLCFVCLALPGAARAEGTPTEIAQLRLERTEEGVLLSANVEFELPPVVDDALQKGIPMYFVTEAVVLRDRWYWYDKPVAAATRHMRLSYHPLTRRWRLVVSPTPIGSSGGALGQSFETREEALAAVRRVSHWKIAESFEVDPDARHNVEFRFRLDVSQLPRPFQIGALGHAEWRIAASRNQRLAVEPPR